MNDEKRRRQKGESVLPPDALLTPRQMQIFEWVAKGKTNQEIADQLYLTIKTVENHRDNICHKLGLEGWGELYHYSHKYFNENG